MVTLEVTRDDLLTVLMGNTDLVQGLFRTLALVSTAERTPPVIRGASPDLVARLDDDPTPGQTVLALQQIPALSDVPAEELSQLASAAQRAPMEPAAVLSSETDPPALFVVLRGELTVADESNRDPQRAGPGDAIGLRETLVDSIDGSPGQRRLRLVVTEAGTALRLDRDELFDLIAHRPILLQRLFRALFGTSASRRVQDPCR